MPCCGGNTERQVITSNQAEAMVAAAQPDRYRLEGARDGGDYRFPSYIAALHGKRQMGGRIIEIR